MACHSVLPAVPGDVPLLREPQAESGAARVRFAVVSGFPIYGLPGCVRQVRSFSLLSQGKQEPLWFSLCHSIDYVWEGSFWETVVRRSATIYSFKSRSPTTLASRGFQWEDEFATAAIAAPTLQISFQARLLDTKSSTRRDFHRLPAAVSVVAKGSKPAF